MKQYLLSADLLNAVLNYLGSKPYTEVLPLINELAKAIEPQNAALKAEPAKSEDAQK